LPLRLRLDDAATFYPDVAEQNCHDASIVQSFDLSSAGRKSPNVMFTNQFKPPNILDGRWRIDRAAFAAINRRPINCGTQDADGVH